MCMRGAIAALISIPATCLTGSKASRTLVGNGAAEPGLNAETRLVLPSIRRKSHASASSPARARGFVCVEVPQIRGRGAPQLVGVFVPAWECSGKSPEFWSRIEPGAVTGAAMCRSLPLLAEQEL